MEFHVPSDRHAPAAARAQVAALAHVLPAGQVQRLQLVVSELVTNAVRHGPGLPVRVSLDVGEDGGVRGEVVDQGEDGDMPHLVEPRRERGGYGLHIVDSLSSDWGVFEGSTHVWFVLDP